MKRRNIAMDADAFISSKVSLVERNPQPMGLQLVNPTAVGRTDRASLIELAQEIEMADEFVQSTAGAQLRLIAEQVSVLRRQAERVLSEAAQSHRLHHAACNFRKAPGSVYHLYRRPSGQEYLSMLAPQFLEDILTRDGDDLRKTTLQSKIEGRRPRGEELKIAVGGDVS
ncbi:uncharacterized protein C1orf50 homolog isoform X2 [Schistocerca cancellata]|uniref:uncharacterized protein C1orf50 homolog isoform X2 n=1 Tax=Schistocerca cancellata TaxID=274614 RepID=UPI00211967D5|nr:uncharacterized protein C1orf50 homolog isoform X2 [Schistocerca cancellata]